MKKDSIFVAHLPEVFGYGLWCFAKTAKEAENKIRSDYFATVRAIERDEGPFPEPRKTWEEAKEWFGFWVTEAELGVSYLEGNIGEAIHYHR